MKWPFRKKKTLEKKHTTRPGNNLNLQGVGTISANWLNWKNDRFYYLAYQDIPQLNSVVNRLSDAFIRGKKQIKTSEGELSDNPLSEVLSNPNPLQSKFEFWETFYRNLQVFERVHVLKLQTGKEIHKLIVLPTIDVEIVAASNFNVKTGLVQEDFIGGYKFTFKGVEVPLEAKDVWTYTGSSLSGDTNGYLYPDNKMRSLLKPLSNIELNYTSRNELIKSHGAIGMISSDNKDADGTVTLTPAEKKDIQEDFKKYLLATGEYKYIITTSALKWTPMSISVKDMMFAEGLQIDTNTIADVMNYPAGLMSAGQSETKYSNLPELRQMVYTDNIISNSQKIDWSFNQEFKEQLGTDKLVTDYSHIEVLQADKEKTAAANKKETENISLLNNQIYNGIITKDVGVNQLIQQGYSVSQAESVLTDIVLQNTVNDE